MEEWKEYKLGDVAKLTTGFPFDGHKYSKEGIRVVRGDNVTIGSLRWDSDKDKRWGENFDRASEFALYDGDIVIGMDGSRVGKNRAQVKQYDLPLLIAQRVACVRHNELSTQQFLYYHIFSDRFEKYIKAVQTGTSIPHVSLKQIGDFPLIIPSIKTQDKIASILKSLDDKIEVNKRINENLEQQAQALFKSWFVDFEPFKNGEFVESELGRIPKGWRVGTFGEIMTIASGKRPPKKESSFSHECNIPLVGASDIMGYTNSVLFNEDILVTGRVGTHGIVQRFNYPCWPSDNTLVLKSDYYEYCYQILCSIDYASLNRGSTQPLITQTDINNQIILIPPYSVLSDFEKYASTLMKAKENNQRSSHRLAELRDTLLPKLMSGELKVNEINAI